MEHFWVTGLIALVFSSLVSSEQKYIMEAPDSSNRIWSWNIAAYVQFPGLKGTWYRLGGQSENTQNRYAICNPDNPQEPNNWLRSPTIEVGDIQRLDVTFRYFSQQCGQSASFCKESFYAYVWESNASVTEQQIAHPINDFQLYRRFANITRQSDQDTILTVHLHVTSKYIVLGIRDQGGCRTLYSVKVSYKVCVKKTLKDRLVSFPSMLAQVESTPVQGICMANSRQIVPGNLTVFCDSDGVWNTSRLKSRCVCKEDMENRQGKCTACPGGTYNEGRGLNCTETPSKPRSASVYFVNESSAILTWLFPEITGTPPNVSYDVNCRPSCEYFSGCEDKTCNSDINGQLTGEGLKTTIFTAANLASFVNYTCKITVTNRVSRIAAAKTQASESERSVTYVNLRTKGSIPGAPEYDYVAYHTETNSITLSWIVKCKNGVIQEYRIEYFSVDDSSGSKNLRTRDNKIQIGSLPAGKTLRFQVYAVNNFGIGSPGVTTFQIPKGDSSTDSSSDALTFIVICVILSAILLIGATFVGVYVYRQRKARNRSGRKKGVSRVGEDNSENSLATPQTSRGDVMTNHSQYIEMTDTPDLELERNEIKFMKLLGSGNFGEVYKAIVNDCIVAVKSLKENASQKDKQDMFTELHMMKYLKSHNHVVQMIGYSTRSDPLLLILEYMPYGDLLGYLRISRGHHDIYNSGEKKPTSRLTDMELLSFAWMIADGMSYLADMRVVHRDLAARNVLVGENEVCKISDFGLTRDVNTEVYVRTSQARLPVKWMPPESLFLGESSTKSDVWSYGIVLWEVFTIGDSPYPGVKPRQVASLLERGYRMPRPNHISEELYSVMSECWSEKPEDRPSFQWICTAMKRLINDHKTYVNLDVYNDEDYVNFDMIDELQ
ncbi:ephrin type-A receptor 3-like isoform X2 [Acropora muricata]|uniref:ephrin type-A receptor 3-like isoform X2 n=1 Tax=Acropora muricata TaxID=159855 RepID=UPI0034E5BCE2